MNPNGMEKTVNGIKCRYTVEYGKGVQNKIDIPMLHSMTAKAKDANVVLELGGHIGIWTELIANSMPDNGRIFVFEPNPNTFATLQKQASCSLSKHKITLINKAVGASEGTLQFEIFPDRFRSFDKSAKSKLFNAGAVVEAGAVLIKVPVLTVDNFCKSENLSPDLIKVDIEGAELPALKGMTNILLQGQAKIIIEMHQFAWHEFGYTGQDFIDFVAKYPKYSLRDGQGNLITKTDANFEDNLKLGYVELLPNN